MSERLVAPAVSERTITGRVTPSIKRIEEKFGQPAHKVVGSVAQLMTVQEMRSYLGVSNPTLVMGYLDIEGRSRSQAHKATWQDPDKAYQLLSIIRSPERIAKQRTSLAETNNHKTEDERRQMTAVARQTREQAMLEEMRRLFGVNPYQGYQKLSDQGLSQVDIAVQHGLSVKKLRGWVRYWRENFEETDALVNRDLWRAVRTRRLIRRMVDQSLMTKEEIDLLKSHFDLRVVSIDQTNRIFEKLSYAVANVVSVADENMAVGINRKIHRSLLINTNNTNLPT